MTLSRFFPRDLIHMEHFLFCYASSNQANKALLPSTIFIFLMFWKITLIDYVPEQAAVDSAL